MRFHVIRKPVLLLLVTLGLPSTSAHAFSWSQRVSYSDPASTASAYFQDRTHAHRAPVGKRWLTEAEIEEGWKNFLRQLDSAELSTCHYGEPCKSGPIRNWLDWGLWRQFNLDATRIWRELVACNGGDAEAARIAYYRAENLCERDRPQGERLREELLALHANLRDFAHSTEVKLIDQYSDELRLKTLGSLLPLHPLFSQIIIEYLATQARFHKRAWNDIGPVAGDASWIDGHPNRTFGDRVDDLILGLADSNSPRYATARAFLNSYLLAALLPTGTLESYQQWGLWREASVLLVDFAGQQYLISLKRRTEGLSFLMWKLMYSGPKMTFPASLARGDGSVVTEFRALAERYGLPTFRQRFCKTKPLVYHLCFAVDPANPDEDMNAY